MIYTPHDDQPDTSYQGILITQRGKVRLEGDPRRFRVVVGDRLEIAGRLTLSEALHRAIAVIRRGRYPELEVSIRPAIDIPTDYKHHGMTAEYEACKRRHLQRQRKARRQR